MIKAAVIGAGAWGKNLVRTLNEMGRLSAVAEIDPRLREQLAQSYPDVTIYDNPDRLLDMDVSAIVIGTPAPTHHRLAKKFLGSGRDVFVEKPMTLSVADSEDLVRTADDGGRILMVGHLLLYQPAVQWMKQALESGMVGKLYSIHQRRLGLGRARDVENVLWSLGVHDVAVALYLIGGVPEDIKVNGQCALQSTIEDDIHLNMTFPGGVHTHLHCSWLWPERERGTVVVGSKAMLVYNELEQTVTLHRKSISKDLKNVDEGSEMVYTGSGEPLRLELEHFLECVETRRKPISNGASGLEVIKVLQAATEEML